ncbi:hypothetical protein SASPL_101564 [Salvia splendens]|uniref:Uncharacterized protein n=1 Tax=Salvia splendens TaxID=180675 RepID=A0A8X9AC11_SALSN|nr:hypothetical protein SASPL_101564 [Salvia splendens]
MRSFPEKQLESNLLSWLLVKYVGSRFCAGHSEALVARGERLEAWSWKNIFAGRRSATYWDRVKILIKDSQLFLGSLFAAVRVEEKDVGADLP